MALASRVTQLPSPIARARPEWSRSQLTFLDGIRGILALAVVLSHGTNLTTGMHDPAPDWMRLLQALGAFSVPGFIFLSGFCLSLPTIQRGFRLESLLEFFRRRAARILPAYFAALACAAMAAVYMTHTIPLSALSTVNPDISGPLLLIQDFYGSVSYNGPLWSLAPEVHIYLCFPLMLWLFRQIHPVKAAATCIILACAAQYFAARCGYPSLSFYLYGIFAVGIYAAWHRVLGKCLPSIRILKWISSSACVLYSILALEIGYARFWEMLPGLSVLECMVLLPVFGLLFQSPTGSLRRCLESPVCQFLGRRSYSLYLTHWIIESILLLFIPLSWSAPLRCALCLLLGVPMCILFASLFYRLFEHPYFVFRDSQIRREVVPSLKPLPSP